MKLSKIPLHQLSILKIGNRMHRSPPQKFPLQIIGVHRMWCIFSCISYRWALRMRKIEIHLCIKSSASFGPSKICTIKPPVFLVVYQKHFILQISVHKMKIVLCALYEPIKFRPVYTRNRAQMQNLLDKFLLEDLFS